MNVLFTALLVSVADAATVASGSLWQVASHSRSDTAATTLPGPQRVRYHDLVVDLALAARVEVPSEVPLGGLEESALRDSALRDSALRDSALRDSALRDSARMLGLELVVTADRFELHPRDASGAAAGVLALRRGELPAEIVLAAPHPFDDLYTGLIAASLFEAAPFRAVYIATQSRGAGAGADGSHNEESSLQLATAALCETLSDPWFVQVHGFGATTSSAQVVVSGGASTTPYTVVEEVAGLIGAAAGVADVHTARSVPQLAAVTNVQGRLVRGRASFLHLELGLALRLVLIDEPARSAALGAALIARALVK